VSLPSRRPVGEVELVHEFHVQMPTGVTVSDDGRIFVCYPRWGDDVKFTVAELRDGEEVPYPDLELQQFTEETASERIVSVQSVVVDPAGRLWLLDTGSIEFGPVIPGGPKLICVDLESDRIERTIAVPPDVALEKTYLNDIRFDLRRGAAGMAFITDSSDEGSPGLIVVDLASGRSWRRLHGHPTTKAVDGHVAIIEGRPYADLLMQSDGIAISADGARLYYCPLASRRLYSVSVDALVDESLADAAVAETVSDHGEKGASDGLETDADGRLYATNYEHGAIVRRDGDGEWEPIAQTPEMRFVDTLAVAADGYLYFTNNQLQLQPKFQDGEDRREPPYSVMRTRIDSHRLRLA
jgi:sugar lactone lactonase YvrE